MLLIIFLERYLGPKRNLLIRFTKSHPVLLELFCHAWSDIVVKVKISTLINALNLDQKKSAWAWMLLFFKRPYPCDEKKSKIYLPLNFSKRYSFRQRQVKTVFAHFDWEWVKIDYDSVTKLHANELITECLSMMRMTKIKRAGFATRMNLVCAHMGNFSPINWPVKFKKQKWWNINLPRPSWTLVTFAHFWLGYTYQRNIIKIMV